MPVAADAEKKRKRSQAKKVDDGKWLFIILSKIPFFMSIGCNKVLDGERERERERVRE